MTPRAYTYVGPTVKGRADGYAVPIVTGDTVYVARRVSSRSRLVTVNLRSDLRGATFRVSVSNLEAVR